MNRTIPGKLDMHALATLRGDPATLHKPTDPASLTAEARRLICAGLSIFDVSHVLGLTPAAVSQLLNQPTDGERECNSET